MNHPADGSEDGGRDDRKIRAKESSEERRGVKCCGYYELGAGRWIPGDGPVAPVDLGETKNLAAEHPAKVKELARKLEEIRAAK